MNKEFYASLKEKINKIRGVIKRPLTYTEKILYSHLWDNLEKEFIKNQDYVELKPDRVAMQDATAQMAIL